MPYSDVIEDAERRTRRRFYHNLVNRLSVLPDPSDATAVELHEYHVGDVAWAAHLMASVCGKEAILDVLGQLAQQMSESAYWDALEQEKAAIRQNAEDLKDDYPEVWAAFQETAVRK